MTIFFNYPCIKFSLGLNGYNFKQAGSMMSNITMKLW